FALRSQSRGVKLSVVIPARNEEGSLRGTLEHVLKVMRREAVPCEIVIADDGSTDSTAERVREMARVYPEIALTQVQGRHGYGYAVRAGLDRATGDAIAIMMADGSDSPEDLARYYAKLQEGFDCVFGSRFIRGGGVFDYPYHKLVLNRLANWLIQ